MAKRFLTKEDLVWLASRSFIPLKKVTFEEFPIITSKGGGYLVIFYRRKYNHHHSTRSAVISGK
jgi:hypothetical protein